MDELSQAYRQTLFEVAEPHGLITLRIDARHEGLSTLMADRGVDSAAYVTAWNPRSQPTSDEVNAAAHERLMEWIRSAGFASYGGWGRDPSGQWPPEKSVLILGISREAACALGREFGQNAIVFVGPDAIPRLEMLVEL